VTDEGVKMTHDAETIDLVRSILEINRQVVEQNRLLVEQLAFPPRFVTGPAPTEGGTE